MKLADIAASINAHLNRFERDPKTNPVDPTYKTRPFYSASASAPPRARKITVIYVSYQGPNRLDRETAERYIAWLDAGNVGTHWEMEKSK